MVADTFLFFETRDVASYSYIFAIFFITLRAQRIQRKEQFDLIEPYLPISYVTTKIICKSLLTPGTVYRIANRSKGRYRLERIKKYKEISREPK